MLSEIKKELKNKFNAKEHDCDDKDILTHMSCRNWGQWELPDDMDDEEDNDFEILTDESYMKMKKIIKELNDKYTKYSITADISEKNYIDFTVVKNNK